MTTMVNFNVILDGVALSIHKYALLPQSLNLNGGPQLNDWRELKGKI
jgi:hypothetical protein